LRISATIKNNKRFARSSVEAFSQVVSGSADAA
jgi:hypothetical protein